MIKEAFFTYMCNCVMDFCLVDPAVVSRVGESTVCQKGCGVYTAAESGGHVGGSACVGGDGCRTGTGGRIQHTIRGLYVVQNTPQVSYASPFHSFYFVIKYIKYANIV